MSITPQNDAAPIETCYKYALLTHSQLFGQRLQLFGYLRFCVAAMIIVGGWFAEYIVGIEHLHPWKLTTIAGVIILYNVIIILLIRPYIQPENVEKGYDKLIWIRHATVVLDYIALTFLIHQVGGARSPFLAFYLLHLALGGIIMSRSSEWVHCLIAYLMLVGLVLAEWKGIIEPQMPVGAVSGDTPLEGRYVLTVFVVYAFLFASMTFLSTGLAHMLRQGEAQLCQANVQLQLLSKHRRDFLHVALHNLKSPVSAVTMQLNNLRDKRLGPLDDKQLQAVQRCLKRLGGCSEFIHDLQNLAAIESGDMEQHANVFDLRPILTELLEENHDLIHTHNHDATIELPDHPLYVRGIQRLIREAVVNFLTNAIKYTPDGGVIILRASKSNDMVCVAIQDDGIGISQENQSRLFNEFVRISHPETDVPGTGLGLSIVKRIIEDHHGHVSITSEIGQGSIFAIHLPLCEKTEKLDGDGHNHD